MDFGRGPNELQMLNVDRDTLRLPGRPEEIDDVAQVIGGARRQVQRVFGLPLDQGLFRSRQTTSAGMLSRWSARLSGRQEEPDAGIFRDEAIPSFGNPGSSGTYAALAFMTASIAT